MDCMKNTSSPSISQPEGFELPPDWNITPTTNQPIIRSDPETGERPGITAPLAIDKAGSSR